MMKTSSLFFLLKKNLFKKKFKCLIIIFSFAVSLFILGLSLSFFIGINKEVIPRLRKSFPENQLIVSPKSLDFTLLKFNTSSIDDGIVEKLKRIDGVIGVYPILTLTMPVRAEGRIFGNEITTDLTVNGVDEEIVKEEIFKGYDFKSESEPYLPVLISQYFIDLYNFGIAEGNNLPKMSDAAIIGRTFDLILGESTILPTADYEKTKIVQCQVVGTTYNRMLLAVVAPIDKIKEYNEWYHNDRKFRYNRVILKIKSPESFENVKKFAEEMNLLVSSEKKTLEQFLFLLKAIFAVIFVFTAFILLLSMMMIMNHYSLVFLERKNEIGIFRAIGGTPMQTLTLYFIEVCFVGFISSFLGLVALKIVINFLNNLTIKYLPSLTMLPQMIFYSPVWLFVVLILAGICLSLLTVLPLIYRFIFCQPAELLNED